MQAARCAGVPRPPRPAADAPVILYGWHTVTAALDNPARRIRKLSRPRTPLRRLAEDRRSARRARRNWCGPTRIAARLTPDAVHQGLIARGRSPALARLEDLPADGIVLVLDQITDPHNVGAILRTPRHSRVAAVVTTARHSPEATGVLAKSASGALELVPIVTVQNLARALAALKRARLSAGRPRQQRRRRSAAIAAARAARARARRRRQGLAPIDPCHLRPPRAPRSSGRDQEPERLERRGAGALRRKPGHCLRSRRSVTKARRPARGGPSQSQFEANFR